MTNAGRVIDALELVDSEVLFVKNGSTDKRWGTAELVTMVESAAAAVADDFPGARLTVGDLSPPRGGRASPHRSHRAGRDVDIGFYLIDAETDERMTADRFITISGSGRGRDHRGRRYRFDVERNWALMRAVLSEPRVDVQFVLINPTIRRTLLRHARSVGADEELLRRFSEVSASRSGSRSHRSHFHVRIYCPSDDRPRCIDAPPLHPWVFDSEELIEKRMTEWREFRPPPRRRARRRGRGRASMGRSRMRRRTRRPAMNARTGRAMGASSAMSAASSRMASPMTSPMRSSPAPMASP